MDQVTSISKNQKFRNQQVVVLIGVPEGKTINMQDCGSVSNYNNNIWELEDWEMESSESKEFIMTNKGLKPLGFREDQSTEKPKEEKNQSDSLMIKKENIEKSI